MFLQLFDSIAYRVAGQMTDNGVAIWVQAPASERPEEKFFFSRLVTILRDTLAAPIFTAPLQKAALEWPADSLQALALSYRLHRCAIIYQPLSSGRWFRSTPWKRTAGVLLEVGAHEANTRQVRFQKIWQESVSDTVAEKSLSRLENANLPFTIGRREKRKDGFNWLEAALITTATGVVVYLFYSLRSR